MKNKFCYTCTKETVYSLYSISDDGKYITTDKAKENLTYCPMDYATEIVVAYLNIGYFSSKASDTSDLVYDFISKYGMPDRKSKKISIKDFSEDAESLYLHFAEITADDYPENPEWILETDPMSGIITHNSGNIELSWQTSGLLNAIEIAYSILLCSDTKQLGVCKHCGAPFYAKNPKSEFCSPQCRNQHNVYKSRRKYK